ncbi:testisin-like [Sarcophilus harrisii]|uniref:Peptidase S1 domain-containing protein n=1 Tax=Sarcophilus harrisii TaxID=9305 RepID=G3VDM5_SARHA|nr:testisin-like [Sarcophilus harrisii]
MGWGGLGLLLLLLLPLLLRAQIQRIEGSELNKVCGQPVKEGRIFGGHKTTFKQWPWQASLQYKSYHWCGATLIHSSWVMTAAHCFQNQAHDPSVWRIQLGSRTIRPPKLSVGQLYFRRVSKIIVHPLYFGWPPKDIALAKLQMPIRFQKNILPICLPTSMKNFENVSLCWVTGWGRIKEYEYLRKPWHLQATELPLIDQETCDQYYHIGTNLPLFITRIYDDMLCAGFVQGQKDTCQGDSGGPLACMVNGIWHQAGIVSWGDGCGKPYRPSVFTNVSVHTDWILEIINSSTVSIIPSKLFLLFSLQLCQASLRPFPLWPA